MSNSQYKEFAEKVSQSFEKIRQKYPSEFQCKNGCHECCKPKLTVNYLEKTAIKDFLELYPKRIELLRNLKKKNPHKGKRCEFLDEQGSCIIYETRPIVCRSHGAPLQFADPENTNKDKALRFRDVCPLNFISTPIDKLTPTDVLNLDTIHTLMVLLLKHIIKNPTIAEERTPLVLENILKR